ncbi:MAG: PQQ-binding-like beta-propeller repeat protein [Candidatus Limnocylindrales bacterium]
MGEHRASAEVRRAAIRYPGGLSARIRWAGSGQGEQVFGSSESGGGLADHGALVGPEPDRLCRAELRIEGPGGTWTARFASRISDDPEAALWDTTGLLLVTYGFHLYALDARDGTLRWTFASRVPLVATFVSSRLSHAIAQGELETTALDPAGAVVWHVPLTDVVVEAAMVGGRLVLTGLGGSLLTLDPLTGRPPT